MTIKSKMLLIILLGIGGLFLANFYSSVQLNAAYKQYSSEESLTAHSSAWFSNMDTQFVSNLLTFDPLDGSERNASFWEADTDAFGGTDEPNPLLASISDKDAETAASLFEQVFSDPIMEDQITFAVAYDDREVFSCIANPAFTSWVLIHVQRPRSPITF